MLGRWSGRSFLKAGLAEGSAMVPGAQAARQMPGNNAVLLASITDPSVDAMVIKRLGGYVTSWNRAAETMYGYNAEGIGYVDLASDPGGQ
jgi:PAS domain-containing protein